MAKKRQKSRLKRALQTTDEKIYKTTLNETRKWCTIINEEIFDGKLPDIDEIDIRQRRKSYAYYLGITDTNDVNFQQSKLCLDKQYKSKKFFIAILGHEMVHHWQFTVGKPLGHGPSFQKWVNKFKKKGLRLAREYDEDEEGTI